MDEDDRDSNASSGNEADETMEDVDEVEPDNEADEEDNEEDGEEEEQEDADAAGRPARGDADQEAAEEEGDAAARDAAPAVDGKVEPTTPSHEPSASPQPPTPTPPRWRPTVRPEARTARLYDIVPTMAAPQSTSINALAATPDMRFWLTGGADGYVRKYDGAGTINGKQLLTVAQRHPFVDSVVKAGVLMSYWENEEPAGPPGAGAGGSARLGSISGAGGSQLGGGPGAVLGGGGGGGAGAGAGGVGLGLGNEDHVLSPVYALAVHSQGLWLLSGLESGGINVHSVRIDEGKRIACLQGHRNAVSVLQLWPGERGVLSGSWDKRVFDWDLHTGQVVRQFEGSGGQISAIELRPAAGMTAVPDAAAEDVMMSDTMETNNAAPVANGLYIGGGDAGLGRNGHAQAAVAGDINGGPGMAIDGADADGTAGDGGADDHESLFGSPGGSLFGDADNNLGGSSGGGGVFGNDDDDDAGAADDFSQPLDMSLRDEHDQTGDATGADGGTVDGDVGMQQHIGEPEDAHAAALSGDVAMGDHAMQNGDTQHTHETAVFAVADGPPASSASGEEATQPEHGGQQPAAEQQEAQGQDAAAGSEQDQDQQQLANEAAAAQPATLVIDANAPPPPQHDPSEVSSTTFLSAGMDGTLRIWDRRVALPVATIATRPPVPPWCQGACWSVNGDSIFAGRRNCTVEEYSIHKARRGWAPERTLKFPAGSGAVSCVRAMANGRHLVCASHDILRLYDLRQTAAFRHSTVPFLIIPGPPRAGVISQLYIDPTSRFMLSTAGTRGWDGSSTEVLIGYEIGVPGT